MTQQEITQNNKLIAEFMGWKKEGKRFITPHSEPINYPVESLDDYDDVLPPDLMRFSSSWDWLMPVVEKIEDMTNKDGYHYNIRIENGLCQIVNDTETIAWKETASKIESTYKAVIQFINWYNEQEK